MNRPKINFIWTTQTEVERILHASRQIANGFYQEKGFCISPKLDYGNNTCIHFPDIEIMKIENYWENAKFIHDDFPIKADEKLISEIKEILASKLQINNELKDKLENNWKLVEEKFWKILQTLMPENIKILGEIEIRFTSFGSVSSYSLLNREKEDQKLICYLREDNDISGIAAIIVLSLVQPNTDEIFFSWEEREAFMDFIMTKSELHKLFKNYKPILDSLHRKDLNLKKQSENYLKKLGAFISNPKLSIKENTVYLDDDCISSKLTEKQVEILKLLIQKTNQIVSFDELGDILWNNTDEFSLWAINKTIQRLRNKLSKLGLVTDNIKTLRGRGYSLVN